MANLEILYYFKLEPNNQKHYSLQFDETTLELVQPPDSILPKWTNLGYHQCQHCPLDTTDVEVCPVAANLVPFIELCGNLDSYQEMDVEVQTNERTYLIKNTSAQRAFSSVLGLVIATSSCPHSVFFRPMARFHLPLANEQETLFRATSSYLLMQYFRAMADKNVDYNLHGLDKIYKNIQIVNSAMAVRLREAGKNDAAVNSIVLLDLLAKEIPYCIDDKLQELEYLYKNLFDLN